MPNIITFVNQKGGVGKTTCTINIGAGLAKLGKKVLLVDLDPQANLTVALGIRPEELDSTIYDLINKDAEPSEVIMDSGNAAFPYSLIPCSINLSGIEVELSGTPGKEFLLNEALQEIKGFDYILLDSPPSLGLLTLNALTTAQEIFIPLQTEFLALQGLSRLIETVDVVKKRLNKSLELTGIIGTRYDQRKILNREVVQKIEGYFGDKLFKTLIRENIALAEAPSHGEDIFTYKPQSYGAKDYLNLCKEILKK